MALSADTRPHFTTLADFISQMHKEIASVFTDVLMYAAELNLIGKNTFAIDGCKMPSNASKQWSGTLKELRHKQKKLETLAQNIITRHRAQDAAEKLSPVVAQEQKKRATYENRQNQDLPQDRPAKHRPQWSRTQKQHHRPRQRQDVDQPRCHPGL